MSKKYAWFPEKLKQLAKTGTLNLSAEVMEDLSFVGCRETMKKLDLSFTHLTSLVGLAYQPKLDSLILDSSDLINFKNFRAVQKISSISLRNTPAAATPNFKLSLLLVIGPSLRVINGQRVSDRLREKAKQYPEIASDLVNCGWMAQYPCPDDLEMEDISQGYGLSESCFDDSDTEVSLRSEPREATIEALVNFAEQEHRRMVEKTEQDLDRIEEGDDGISMPDSISSNEVKLIDKLEQLLLRHGFEIGQENRGEAILDLISSMLEDGARFAEIELEEEEEDINVVE